MRIKLDPNKCQYKLGDEIEINGVNWFLAEGYNEGEWTLKPVPVGSMNGVEVKLINHLGPKNYRRYKEVIKKEMRKIMDKLIKRPCPMPREMKPAAWKLRGLK